MSISQNLEINHKNQIENIKNEENHESKMKQIGALVLDLGERSINAVAKACKCCWRFVKKCYIIVKDGLEIVSNRHNSGRKKVTKVYPTLEANIKNIMDGNSYQNPHFDNTKPIAKFSISEVKKRLLETGKYEENFIAESTLSNLLNDMGYKLKRVKRNKPLKKIEKTDAIFDNVNEKKEEAMSDAEAALISIDAKEKVPIGPYSRRGKNRVLVEACDHELTNRCLIPFGILDIKTNQPYFYNFTSKPTSLAIVDCIEDYIIQNSKYKKVYILLDNGPDNSGVRTAFLKGLVDLSIKYNITIELIYYPPYHSKYNPVERVWGRLEQMWNGSLLTSEEICNKIMEQLTWNGVHSKVKFVTNEYEKGVTYSKEEMSIYEGKNILRNEQLKKWSITITPFA